MVAYLMDRVGIKADSLGIQAKIIAESVKMPFSRIVFQQGQVYSVGAFGSRDNVNVGWNERVFPRGQDVERFGNHLRR